MLKQWKKQLLQNLVLVLAGRNPRPYTRDVEDELYDHPELTERQADWKLNGRKYIIKYMIRVLCLICAAVILYWIFSR